MYFLGILLSWFIVAFGQPAWVSWLSPLSASIGYALFWVCVVSYSRWHRIALSIVWFATAQLIQLSWMSSIDFQGYYILFVYGSLSLWLGIQFGLLTAFVPAFSLLSCNLETAVGDGKLTQSFEPEALSIVGPFTVRECALPNEKASGSKPCISFSSRTVVFRFKRIAVLAAFWTLMEWSRLFILCGFSWNPIGLSLTAYTSSLQMASVAGIYGLSFWVILVNLVFLKALLARHIPMGVLGVVLAACPYLFGICHLAFHDFKPSSQGRLSVALVQTALLPSEKVPLPGRIAEFISPDQQWRNIFFYLEQKKRRGWDLIVLPEAAIPLQAQLFVYPYNEMVGCLKSIFGEEVLKILPPLQPPFAQKGWFRGQSVWCVSNSFLGQLLANWYNAEVVIGLDHTETGFKKSYNAAFYFSPFQESVGRYDKQVLLPLAEYLPFELLRPLTKSYGISEFFSQGKGAKVFGKKIPFSVSICYEETFAHLMREGRLKGAQLFINVTNDNYYPFSRLPQQHFHHGRVRAVENGLPLIRSCNTGVTAVVDSCGRSLFQFGGNPQEVEWKRGVLDCSFNVETHATLYMIWGDFGIISVCFLILVWFLWCKKKERSKKIIILKNGFSFRFLSRRWNCLLMKKLGLR